MKIGFWHGASSEKLLSMADVLGAVVVEPSEPQQARYIEVTHQVSLDQLVRAFPDQPWMVLPGSPGWVFTSFHKNFNQR